MLKYTWGRRPVQNTINQSKCYGYAAEANGGFQFQIVTPNKPTPATEKDSG